MKPWLDDGDVRLYLGDVREVLRGLPGGSVHACVTSPPYWGLRDYGTGRWEGGDASCEHDNGGQAQVPQTRNPSAAPSIIAGPNRGGGSSCVKCGAVRVDPQIGLEESPEAYVQALVGVFAEVARVLRPEGTLWLNLGDTYAGAGYGNHDINGDAWKAAASLDKRSTRQQELKKACQREGIKPKDMVGIPWAVAFALRAAGWYLRSEVIWHKPAILPESVEDRPTNCTEKVFLLARQPRYFYDHVAVLEDAADGSGAKRNMRNVWSISPRPFAGAHFATFPPELPARCIAAGTSERGCCAGCGAPWVRLVERGEVAAAGGSDVGADNAFNTGAMVARERLTAGWKPSCGCGSDAVVPAVVLDPFFGSGTTGLVARQMGRHAVGVELNPEYAEIAKGRLAQQGLFA